ncbi:unnamed protein product [Cyprideis torosa]|uniref:Uncharacterized protein n=1 Tax=Cyprideis torosa TaxID=163714 RepID=A0A7R8WP56_9CRUS|nr:unnamed protein product [Cyprideis torosa]CAG0904761.1 unnamed protein product [Cyprideis torosa]
MASGIQKEPSALEIQSLDEVFHLTKSEDFEVPNDPNDLSGSGENVPLLDVIPGSMDNDNQTCDVPDQIERDTIQHGGSVRHRRNGNVNQATRAPTFRRECRREVDEMASTTGAVHWGY